MTITKTLSIPESLNEFLKENPDLSPSKMLQSKIIEIKEQRRLNSNEIDKWKRLFHNLEKQLQEANEKIYLLENKKRKKRKQNFIFSPFSEGRKTD